MTVKPALLPGCVTPEGRFAVCCHRPAYTVRNQRVGSYPARLGELADGSGVENQANFPTGAVEVGQGEPVYEITNPLPFRGATFISQSWAEARAANPESIRLPAPPEVSFHRSLAELTGGDPAADASAAARAFALLPQPLLVSLALSSTDPADLVRLAEMSCEFIYDQEGKVCGQRYEQHQGRPRPLIKNHDLFECVVNNPHLPEAYKRVMVLRPGVQGGSEIVGEYGGPGEATHVFEYLRRNSYIPWGHYAANLADDAVRYAIADLTPADMTGLRHLYYQRTFLRLAEMLGIAPGPQGRCLSPAELEELRLAILTRLAARAPGELSLTGILWGWNFGFDFSGSGYRLHASHQQIHQQYALLPPTVEGIASPALPSFACGDLVAQWGRKFRQAACRGFFAAYLEAIRANTRPDGRADREASLIVHEDEQIILFVPKAQVSQWELQIICKGEVGNILEADLACRHSLDQALFLAQRILAGLGARMVTSIEYSKRIDNPDRDQRLLYALLPKLPYSMGAFSEAQQRWVSSHFPEDFAIACRKMAAQLA